MMKQSDYEVAQTGPPPGTDGTRAKSHRRRRNVFITLVLLILLILLMLLGWFIFPSARVTITPVSQTTSNMYKLQVQARMISITTPAQSQAVEATGSGQTKAVQAKGTVTIYNYTPKDKFIPAHTRFTDKRGVQYETVQDITVDPDPLPAGQPGFASVGAQAVQAGEHGNSKSMKEADTIDTELSGQLKGVWVVNAGSFTGGQDLVTYKVVQQSDINHATDALRNVLTPEANKLFASQIGPNEQSVAPAQLTLNASANHAPGDKATQVTVTGRMSASGEVYNVQAAKEQAVNLLKQEVAKKLGPDYLAVGAVTGQVLQAQVVDNQGTVELLVQVQGTWAYHLSDSRKQQLAQLITGKNVDEARVLLLQQPGVSDVRIDLYSFDGKTLPLLPDRIEF